MDIPNKLFDSFKTKLRSSSGKLQLFFVCWLLSFSLLGAFLICISFDSPIAAINLTFSKLAITDGFEIADCQPGYKTSYKYTVGDKEYKSMPVGPCKRFIPAGKKLKIYYVIDRPEFSWAASNPREDAAFLFFACCVFSLIIAGRMTYVMAKKSTRRRS